MKRGAYIALHIGPAVLLVAALGPWPYWYYLLLPYVICISAAWLAVMDYQQRGTVGPWVIALGIGAILFNPVIPIPLTREIWFLLNLGLAAVLAIDLRATWDRQLYG